MASKPREHLFSVTKKDLDVQTFRSGGPGGQKQNKVETGVRIVHKDSGAVGESREERSQAQNKKIAFRRLVESSKFKIWLNRRAYAIMKSKTIDQIVDEQMQPEYIKMEVVGEDGKWIESQQNYTQKS
jgi:protein subunit release factor B